MKKFALILPFGPLLLGIFALSFFSKPSGFGVHKISSQFPYHPEWEIQGLDARPLSKICSQPFCYLGNGAQSFVFASQDGKYVIKFFKMKHLTSSKLGNLLPFSKYKEKNLRHEQRLKKTFAACKMAYEELKEETGLIYVHLNPTKDLNQQVTLFDRKGKQKFVVDLDSTVFILQERAQMIYKKIESDIKKGNPEDARQALAAVVNLVRHRNEKGFKDVDTGVSKNYGFIGTRPVHIDFLGLIKTEDADEADKIESKMVDWVEKHYPGTFITLQ